MKKFAMAAVAAAAMTVGGAHAYTSGTFSNGVVIPNVIHLGDTNTTAVGLVNQEATSKGVFWTFFDQDSKHVTDGCFVMTAQDYHPFVWSREAGNGTSGIRGYLTFTLGAGPDCSNKASMAPGTGLLAAHAFQVDAASKDVAFTPVIDGPLTFDDGTGAPGPSPDLTTLGAGSLLAVAGAAQAGVAPGTPATRNANFNMRYYLQDGASTNIVVWSTGDHSGSHTVNIFDDKQNRKSVNFNLVHEELDWFDPSQIVGRPADFTDGFIEWNANDVLKNAAGARIDGSVFSYSVVSAPAFGAVQTVLGFHR